MCKYVFEDKNDLVKLLYKKLNNPTQIKVQKTLYLLFAYYGASYGTLSGETDDTDFYDQNYPEYLFDEHFQAWQYGPVDFDVYRDEKNGKFISIPDDFLPNFNVGEKEKININAVIDNIVDQTNSMDDFSLVELTHQDDAWFDVYDGSKYIKMDREAIVGEYINRIKRVDSHNV